MKFSLRMTTLALFTLLSASTALAGLSSSPLGFRTDLSVPVLQGLAGSPIGPSNVQSLLGPAALIINADPETVGLRVVDGDLIVRLDGCSGEARVTPAEGGGFLVILSGSSSPGALSLADPEGDGVVLALGAGLDQVLFVRLSHGPLGNLRLRLAPGPG